MMLAEGARRLDAGPRSLAGFGLFEGLTEAERRQIESQCRWRVYRARERIVDAGNDSRDVFFVVRGGVTIVDFSLSGREIAFAAAKAGDFFGELSAIDGQPRSASVIAAEESLVAVLPTNAFLALLRGHAEIAFRVLRRLVQMVRSGDVRIMELSTLAATQRVCCELLRMAERDRAVPDLWIIRPLPPLREIAGRTSTTRETVTRALAQLAAAGLVRRKGRNLYLMDRARMQAMAQVLHLHGSAKPAD